MESVEYVWRATEGTMRQGKGKSWPSVRRVECNIALGLNARPTSPTAMVCPPACPPPPVHAAPRPSPPPLQVAQPMPHTALAPGPALLPVSLALPWHGPLPVAPDVVLAALGRALARAEPAACALEGRGRAWVGERALLLPGRARRPQLCVCVCLVLARGQLPAAPRMHPPPPPLHFCMIV